jgi:hypothetical protein
MAGIEAHGEIGRFRRPADGSEGPAYGDRRVGTRRAMIERFPSVSG